MKKRPGSYLVNAALASGVLYYVLDLSQAGRTAVDFVVIALVVGAILWNFIQLGRRLYQTYGARAVWQVQRTLAFWLIGLFNTLLIRAEDAGSWKNWLGWCFLLIAVIDSIALYRKERSCSSEPTVEARQGSN